MNLFPLNRHSHLRFLWLCYAILLAVAAAVALTGCHSGTVYQPGPTPQTVFSPATTVPSVTPAASTAVGAAQTVYTGAAAARDDADKLTPQNLPQQKPALMDCLRRLVTDADTAVQATIAAQNAAAANDAAVKAALAERDAARKLVSQREAEMKAMADGHAKELKEKDAKIAKLQSEDHRKQVFLTSIIIGAVVFFAVFEMGAGWVVGAILGAMAFALVPYVIDDVADSLHAWIKWGVPIGAALLIAFAFEAKTKGGILAAIHDRFAKQQQGKP